MKKQLRESDICTFLIALHLLYSHLKSYIRVFACPLGKKLLLSPGYLKDQGTDDIPRLCKA